MCRSSEDVNRFRPFQALAALFGPADVIAEAPVVVRPPPMTIPPGPRPVTKARFDGKTAKEYGSKLKPAREKPARNTLSSCGEKTCVSWKLATWLRSAKADPNKGSAKGVKLFPSSIV